MNKLDKLISNFKQINANIMFLYTFKDKALQDRIIDVCKYRVQVEGFDLNDERLRTDVSRNPKYGGRKYHYARRTERIKEKKSGIASEFDHVTLTDTGAFWKSAKFFLSVDYFKINADWKKDGRDISENFSIDYKTDEEFRTAILGVNDEIRVNVINPILRIKGLEKIKNILNQ